jgi:hypothetical protein
MNIAPSVVWTMVGCLLACAVWRSFRFKARWRWRRASGDSYRARRLVRIVRSLQHRSAHADGGGQELSPEETEVFHVADRSKRLLRGRRVGAPSRSLPNTGGGGLLQRGRRGWGVALLGGLLVGVGVFD